MNDCPGLPRATPFSPRATPFSPSSAVGYTQASEEKSTLPEVELKTRKTLELFLKVNALGSVAKAVPILQQL